MQTTEDGEIYSRAMDIIGSITSDFNSAYYEEILGELEVKWSEDRKFNARAFSNGDLNNPPQHNILFFYETARRIYRDGEALYEFISGPVKEYENTFRSLNFGDASFNFEFHEREHFVNNFFAAGITYLFGHEIGHLIQEHTHIRSQFGGANAADLAIDESDASNSNQELTQDQSVIWHVTELAADHEAVSWCLSEIFRHVVISQENPKELDLIDEEHGRLFMENSLIFALAMTCVHFRFNGIKAITPAETPVGSHPHPMLRIELNIFQLIGGLDFYKRAFKMNFSKKEISLYINKGVTAANILWVNDYFEPERNKVELIVGGVINHNNTKKYLKPIISKWDQISDYVESIKRFKTVEFGDKNSQDFGMMFFDEHFRNTFVENK
ncbi:MAG: hypothetical protein RR882_08150 [Comamonas sp.]